MSVTLTSLVWNHLDLHVIATVCRSDRSFEEQVAHAQSLFHQLRQCCDKALHLFLTGDREVQAVRHTVYGDDEHMMRRHSSFRQSEVSELSHAHHEVQLGSEVRER